MAAEKARMPYFQMYAADWLASGKVASMTTEEAGAHFFLMCQAWLSDPPASIPDDDGTLARWARLSVDDWKVAKVKVLAAWKLRGGRWYQPRMEIEWGKATGTHVKLSDAGKRGNAKRWAGNRQAIAGRSGGDPKAIASSESESESESERTTRPKPVVVDPSGGNAEPFHVSRMQIITALTGVGFKNMQAIRLAATPGLTIQRVEWVIEQARKNRVTQPTAYIAKGIEQGWEPDKGPLAEAPPAKAPAIHYGAWK